MGKLADRTLQLLKSFSSLDSSSQALAHQLHGSGVALWNKAVFLRSAATISLFLNAQRKAEELMYYTACIYTYFTVRYIALTIILLCTMRDNTEQMLKKQITVYIHNSFLLIILS